MGFVLWIGLIIIAISIGLIVWYLSPKVSQKYYEFRDNQMQKTASAFDEILMPIKPATLNILYLASIVGSAAVAYILFKGIEFVLLGAVIGPIIPFLIVRVLSEIRRRKFIDQLVDTLSLLSSSLKAGLTLPQAFEVVVEEMPSPTREEFMMILQQIKMGFPLEEALTALRKRIKDEDLDLVVISVLVARETGGNITEIFKNLSFMIREKKKLMRRVQVLTAQARLQGMIISVMPILFVPFVLSQNPHHFDVFLKDSIGQMLLVGAAIFQVIGLFMMRKLSKIDV